MPTQMTTSRLTAHDAEQLIIDRLQEQARAFFPEIYLDLPTLLSQRWAAIKGVVVDAVANLVASGRVEAEDHGWLPWIRLSRLTVIEMIVADRQLFAWLEVTRGSLSERFQLRLTAELLAGHTEYALKVDALGAFETALAVRFPRIRRDDARTHGARALESTILGTHGTVDPATTLRTMLALTGFTGGVEDLIDTAGAIAAAAA